jgi:hypothetical protein
VSNRTGTAYALTTFARLLPGKADEVEASLEALDVEAVFGRLPMLHIARVQIFRALVHQGPEQRHTDTLQHAHLVFTSTFDGEPAPYLDALAERVPECDVWWSACAGYPGREDRARFRAWVRSIQVDTGLFQSAIPKGTVSGVRDSLALRERLIDFAVATQGLSAAELHERFRAEF